MLCNNLFTCSFLQWVLSAIHEQIVCLQSWAKRRRSRALNPYNSISSPPPSFITHTVYIMYSYNKAWGNINQVHLFLEKNINKSHSLYFNQIMMRFSNTFMVFSFQRCLQNNVQQENVVYTVWKETDFVYHRVMNYIECKATPPPTLSLILGTFGHHESP